MRYLTVLLLLVISNSINGQSLKKESLISTYHQKCKIEGVVLDAENKYEPLLFAEVTVKELDKTISTRSDGSFKLELKPGKYTFIYSFIGYETVEIPNILVCVNKPLKLSQTLEAQEIQTTENLEIAALFKS
tara:strand:+ start:250 stop:645 length:396 start_codon:yes stop_codon:yes gene_type:complete